MHDVPLDFHYVDHGLAGQQAGIVRQPAGSRAKASAVEKDAHSALFPGYGMQNLGIKLGAVGIVVIQANGYGRWRFLIPSASSR